MANTQGRELSSVFDDMLAQNKKRFDDLYGRDRRTVAVPPAVAKVPITAERASSASPRVTQPPRLDPDSAAARRLKERFGNDWRYEIVEQRRDGDEAIVLCKLFLGKEGAVRAQFGRAKISQGPVVGASGDVHFRLGTAGAEQEERNAFRLATEAALMNCIDLT
jgi:hypothetical protein